MSGVEPVFDYMLFYYVKKMTEVIEMLFGVVTKTRTPNSNWRQELIKKTKLTTVVLWPLYKSVCVSQSASQHP